MTDSTISHQSPNGNENYPPADKIAHYASLGYRWNPETGTWQLKPKEPKVPKAPAELSKKFLNLPDEDYSDCVCLLLPKNEATLVDAAMFEKLCKFDWQVLGRTVFLVASTPVTYTRRRCGIGRTGYGNFRSPARKEMVSIHRYILSCNLSHNEAIGFYKRHVDHRNRNPWDCRLANLRVATPSQNAHNTGKRKGCSSQYKGVSKVKGKEKWTAQIQLKGKMYYLGTFDDEFKAAQAYNRFVRERIPEFGYINPLTIEGDC